MITTLRDKEIIRSCLEIRKSDLEKKSIVIFGCTPYARSIRDALSDWGMEVVAIIDNNPDKVGKDCMGIKVYRPEEYLLPYQENILVIVCSKYHYEMKQQVLHMGYAEQDALDIIVMESIGCSDNSKEDFNNRVMEIKKGYMIYKNIIKKYPNNSKVFLCPYPGTGDVYMACSFLNQYIVKEGINSFILVVNGNSCFKVGQLFGIENIEAVSEEEKELLLKAWEFLGSRKMVLKPLLHWGWRTKRYLLSDNHSDITFAEMFKYDVFGLDAKAKSQGYKLDADNTFCEKLFAEMKLKKGKTIILAPYASSFHSNIPMEEWEELVDSLQSRGYDVCTNCYGKKEKPIKNTNPIWFPYREGISLLNYAGGFIAVRSGLCDILSQSNCKMVILYENGFNASSYGYFSLKKMGLNENVIEFIYDESVMDAIIKVFE